MALQVGINSYSTVSAADTYLLDKLDVAAWVSADNTSKEQALVTATRILDEMAWIGQVTNTSQTLAWPREGQYFDEKYNQLKTLTGIPDRILRAQYELAYHLLNNDGLLDNSDSFRDIVVGPIKLSNKVSVDLLPREATRLILPLLTKGSTSRSWWRAN